MVLSIFSILTFSKIIKIH